MLIFQWLWELMFRAKESDDCPKGGKHDWKMFTRQRTTMYMSYNSPGSDRCSKCGETKRVNEDVLW